MTTPTKKLDPTPRQYHVVLTDGERTVTAAALDIRSSGALALLRADDTEKIVFAAGHWLIVELETQDE